MPTMRHSLTLLTAFILLLGFTGCRSKKELVLYHPGDTQVWHTVQADDLRRLAEERPRVEIETTKGSFVIELFKDEAPLSVANFLEYVNGGFYEGTVFHRIEPGLVIQGGGFTADLEKKETSDPIPNEAGNGIRNIRGTVGVARTADMNSGTSQFYINLLDNPGFNGDGVNDGYAVFGRVYSGMDVVDSIAMVETTDQGMLSNVPVEPVEVLSAKQVQ